MIDLTAKDGSLTFKVRVQPRASQSRLVGEIDGALKIRLAAPPVEGEANQELVKLLSKTFNLPRDNVTIVAGLSSRNKLVRLTGISIDDFEKIMR